MTPSADQIRNQIKEIIADVTEIAPSEIADSLSFREDLDLDSLSLLEIAVDVDYTFQLGLPDERFQEFATLEDTVRVVEQTLREKAAAEQVTQ